MTDPRWFAAPPLGDVTVGEVVHRGRQGEVFWQGEHAGYRVTLQEDRPAVAFRCHQPGMSFPCSEDTALDFIAWVELEARVAARFGRLGHPSGESARATSGDRVESPRWAIRDLL